MLETNFAGFDNCHMHSASAKNYQSCKAKRGSQGKQDSSFSDDIHTSERQSFLHNIAEENLEQHFY